MKPYISTRTAVRNILFYKDEMVLACRSAVWREKNGELEHIANGWTSDTPISIPFMFKDKLYFRCTDGYVAYDGKEHGNYLYENVTPYVPTTTIGRKPSGGGKEYEDVNLLTGRRINSFVPDGESKAFHLDATNIKKIIKASYYAHVGDKVPYEQAPYTVDKEKGIVTFTEGAPPVVLTDGQDSVFIEFEAESGEGKIDNCTECQVFDNRVFVGGDKDYPSYIRHSKLEDPTYFGSLDYYTEGFDNSLIKSIVAGTDALYVFREPSQEHTTIFKHRPTIDAEYGKIYPSEHSSIAIGCVGKAINFNDDIVFFSEKGMEGVGGDITTENAVQHRSSMVDRMLTAEKEYKNMILTEWDGYLLVIIGDKIYLADSRAATTVEGHTEYDWFYWEMEKEITCATVHDGMLYLGTADGVYTLDGEDNLESYWTTPKDKFRSPAKLKTTNKRGCVCEATGDITVFAKTEDTEFEENGTYEDVKDYFVCRIKRKKWKDIQLKFYSNTRFSLESATLEAFVGGYIKR
jgi:hypothetical protein